MSDPKFTLRVETTGATEAKTGITGVTDAVEANTDAVRRAGDEARKSSAARRAAIAEVQAEIAAEKSSARAKEESAKAMAREAEGLSDLEKQAKRAADQVERLALARGKDAGQAAALADRTFDAVATGAKSPAAAVWSARSTLAAERAALKELAEESARAEGGLTKVGTGLESAATKSRGLAAAGRLLANAFLPDALVARLISGGQALGSVLATLSASTLALGGVVGGALLAAFLALRSAWKDNEQAAERLNRTIEEQSQLQEEAAKRGDLLHSILGPAYETARRAAEEAERANERYVFSLERAAEWIRQVHEAEQGRIDQTARAEKAAINSRYQPQIADLRRQENALHLEESRLDTEYRQKLRATSTPEERRALSAEREDKLGGVREVRDRVRRELEAVESRRDDEKAAVDRVQADKTAAEAARVAAEKFWQASRVLEEATKKLAPLESKRLQEEAGKDELEKRFRNNPTLAARAGILDIADPERRKEKLESLRGELGRRAERAGKLDTEIRDYEDSPLPKWLRLPQSTVDYRRNTRERATLGDPKAAITLIENLLKSDNELPGIQKAAQEAANARDKAIDDRAKAKTQADFAAREVGIVRSNGIHTAANRELDAESRATEAAVRSTAGVQAGLDRRTFDREARNLGASASREVAAALPELAAEVDRFAGALGDGANKGEIDNLRAALSRAIGILEKRQADTASLSDINSRLAALERGQSDLSGQIRAAR